MIKIENTAVSGWEAAIRGMRNPMNSWEKSDTINCCVGENDLALMLRLAKAGPEHAKFLRMITVTMDIVAPDYWFKEFSTYRVGVTENSTSTMHRIAAKEFTMDDFSNEHLFNGKDRLEGELDLEYMENPTTCLNYICRVLNYYRKKFIETGDKRFWWQMIQLLPMSYNYRRTVCLNYAVLANMYRQRKNHKLDEWRQFCEWVESLPYSELITLK